MGATILMYQWFKKLIDILVTNNRPTLVRNVKCYDEVVNYTYTYTQVPYFWSTSLN